ncbi:MAG: lipoyl(octanoyl) transferase LipB [Syntrophobacteraceae bacterium]
MSTLADPGGPRCRTCWLGRMEYRAAWELQQRLVEERSSDRIADTLLLLEHPPTFTLGKRTDAAHLLVTGEDMQSRGAALVHVDRGGDVTFHGPGQLVGYPIISLAGHTGGAGRYMRDLEETLIRALADLGIAAGRVAGLTGVWVGDEKIAAIGARINVKRVTSHGFALNVSTDLSYFEWIIPCGIRGRGVTSLQRLLGRDVPFNAVIASVVRAFRDVLGRSTEPIEAKKLLHEVRK